MGMMPRRVLLALDASAGVASVALFVDEQVVDRQQLDRHGSAEALAPAVVSALSSASLVPRDVTEVCVGAGPGSFTGLRVAAALAKGIARGSGARLLCVPSLPLMVGSLGEAIAPGNYTCVLDALRGEWFAQDVTVHDGARWTIEPHHRLDAASRVRSSATEQGRTLIGPPIDSQQQPQARCALLAGMHAVSLNTWEPVYGRLAEAQVKWEAEHGQQLPAA
jgi:tRNA threonylcarbamoyladenosine biosynthesis protein TsaB